MASRDVRSEIVEALRRYGFYIFDRSKQELVVEALRAAGDSRSLVKVRSLPQNPNYLILEVDAYAFEAACRERCSRDGLMNSHCYGKCVADVSKSLVEKLIAALSG